jgi:hypothetical protein
MIQGRNVYSISKESSFIGFKTMTESDTYKDLMMPYIYNDL